MARKPADVVAKAAPVSVRFAPDDHAWLMEVGRTRGVPEVIREAVRRVRREADSPKTDVPKPTIQSVVGGVTHHDFAQLSAKVERMTEALTSLASAVEAVSRRDGHILIALGQQVAQVTALLISVSNLLSPNSLEVGMSTAVETWEARQSS